MVQLRSTIAKAMADKQGFVGQAELIIANMIKKYNPKVVEKKWQKRWQEQEVYKADLQSSKPKYISMSMFNYPSGAGIHIGHAMNYTISDVLARFKRQQGYESYHPVGWDSFGLKYTLPELLMK